MTEQQPVIIFSPAHEFVKAREAEEEAKSKAKFEEVVGKCGEPIMIIDFYKVGLVLDKGDFTRGYQTMALWNMPSECKKPCKNKYKDPYGEKRLEWYELIGYKSGCRCAIDKLIRAEKYCDEYGEEKLADERERFSREL